MAPKKMGWFFNNFICFGFIIKGESKNVSIQKNWKTKFSNGYFVFVPSTYYGLGESEIKDRKHVTLDKIEEIDVDLMKKDNIFKISEKDKKTLLKLHKKCKEQKVECGEIKKWYVKTSWSSWDPEDMGLHLNEYLEIK